MTDTERFEKETQADLARAEDEVFTAQSNLAARLRELVEAARIVERAAILRYATIEGADLTRDELLEAIAQGAHP